jgi:hypothetical protein
MRMAAGLALIAVSLFTAACSKAPAGDKGMAADVPVAAEQDSSASAAPVEPANVTLRVWVPAGVVGDRYWIYLNGHIATAPTASDSTDGGTDLIVVKSSESSGEGKPGTVWELFGPGGVALRIRHEQWDSQVTAFLSEAEPHHLFKPVDLPLPPGNYTVDLLIESRGTSSSEPNFPFAITHRRAITVASGKMITVVAGIPDDWVDRPDSPVAAEAGLHCRLAPGAAGLDGLQLKLKAYNADAVVNALRGAMGIGNGLVLLKLPPSLGGARDFDGPQLKEIIGAVDQAMHFASERDLSDCEQVYPDFSTSFAAYGEIVGQARGEIDGFEKEADRLIAESAS